jgi:tetratricopeptide (TPR) repeat protein
MEFYDKALQIREQVLNPLSPDLAISYSNIGLVYDAQGNYDKAMEFYNKALQIKEQVLNPLSPSLATSYNNIGVVYFEMENYDKALEYFNKALPGCIKNFGEENDDTIFVKQMIEQCKQALGE